MTKRKMLQYKIPQNVGIADKIVGPFSLRQLIILAIGGGISYVLFAITSRIYELNILEYILILFPALFALALAMIKVHNVTFGKYLLLLLEFAIKPKKRLWDHRGISALVAPDLSEKVKTAENKEKTEKKAKSVNLRDLSLTLDSGGFEHVQTVAHRDIDGVEDEDLITAAYFDHKKGESKTENMYWRTRDMQKKKLDILAKKPTAVKSEIRNSKNETNSPSALRPSLRLEEKSEISSSKQITEENQKSERDSRVPPVRRAGKPENDDGVSKMPKKKRKRKKRKKLQAMPVRQDNQIDSTSKTQPVRLMESKREEGETSFDDLTLGREIEFNLNQ